MPTLDRDGVAIYYEDHGPKDADTLPVLLTHGYAATCLMWRPQVEAFADRYRLIGWDMRGHGQSDSPRRRRPLQPRTHRRGHARDPR